MSDGNTNKKDTLMKVPPHNIEAEQAVLGSLLIDKEAIIKVADIITPGDFYKDIHQIILESMLYLFEKREPIDLLSLSNRLEEVQKLDLVGGRSYLATLANVVPTSSHVVHYSNMIQKKATLRRLINSASEIAQMGYDEEKEVDSLLDKAERSVFEVSQKFLKQGFIPIQNLLSEAFDRMDELHRDTGKLRGLACGFPDLDNVLAGFQKSDLIILAARPSIGKTSLALDFARQAAIKNKASVALFSLEMSKEQLIDRMLCSEAKVSLWKFRTGRLSDQGEDNDFTNIAHSMGKMSEAKIFIDDSAVANVMEIRTKSRRLASEHGLDLIIVDYLQLMEGRGNSDNRVQEVAEITRGLKAVARELNVPVIGLSQLSRAVEMSTPAIPKLAHLRESGSIEQDADVVMFIYRKAMDRNYQKEDIKPEDINLAEIHIAKHRNGPTGIVKLRFNENSVCFENDIGKRYSESEESPF
ncbi:replicative DNA helicase [Patescibacteria group bacterium]|nr:replicative DNA helicase [Patescibacteria group bacterium]MBU1890359.1 replicative DNA helicase [Patescibacteria group bacterium]